MRVNGNNIDHALEEDAGHKVEHETKEEQEGEHASLEISSAAAEVKRVFDKTELDDLQRELESYDAFNAAITGYWDDPVFLGLIQDPAFYVRVGAICRQQVRRLKGLAAYDWEDLRQDVLLKLRNWHTAYPGEKPSGALLSKIAYNRLIDVQRRHSEQSPSLEAMELDELPVKEPGVNPALALQKSVEARNLYYSLKARREQELFIEYFIYGMSASEIARKYGVTRQAVAKRLDRLLIRLKQLMDG